MADFQEQLQAILSDPEAMGQITSIARALTGSPSQEAASPPPEPEAQDVDFVPVNTPPSATPPQDAQTTGTPDLSALLGMMGNGSIPELDPKLIQTALRVYAEYSAQDNEKAALLSALKPFLRAERLEKMEKAEKIARLSRLVRVAIQLLKEGDKNV